MTTRREPLGQKADVQEERVAPVAPLRPSTRTMTPEEQFLLTTTGKVQTVEGFRNEDTHQDGAGVNIIHTRPGTVMMWKPIADGTYSPRTVAESSRSLNLKNGWKITCPQCGTNHEASPYPPGDPNACPARDPVAVRVCPVCNKRVFDNIKGETSKPADFDPNVIQDDTFEKTTPAQRTEITLRTHMWLRHPQQSMMRGLAPLPQAMGPLAYTGRPV